MENQTQTTAPEVAQIAEELATLETRREEIARECQSGQITLKKAKSGAIEGTGTLETVVEAQTRANALSSTLEMMEARLCSKRAQLASAQAQAKREQQEAELFAAGLDFEAKRAALETGAREFAGQFEAGLIRLIANIRATADAEMAVERAGYAMEMDEGQKAPRTLEREGKTLEIAAIRNRKNFLSLAASFGDGLTRRLIADGITTRIEIEASETRSREQLEREQRGHNRISRELEADEIASPTAYADPSKIEVRSFSR
jgi:hypothetical protein